MTTKRIEISTKTIAFIALFGLSLMVLWRIKTILLTLFICLIFMLALNPTVSRLEKLKIPRPLAIFLIYLILIAVIAGAVAGIIPVLIEQTSGLVATLPGAISNFRFFGMSATDIYSQLRILDNLPSQIAQITISIFSNIFSLFVVLVITFYLLMERRHLYRQEFSFLSDSQKRKVLIIVELLEKRLGSWVTAELILMSTIGLLAGVGYYLIGLKYVLPLAIIAGLLEAVPNIGPTVSTALAVIIGFTVSPLTALFALGWGIIIQFLENNLIVPNIMRQSIGINPLVTILAISTGAEIGGIIGAVLAVPIYICAEVIIKVLSDKPVAVN